MDSAPSAAAGSHADDIECGIGGAPPAGNSKGKGRRVHFEAQDEPPSRSSPPEEAGDGPPQLEDELEDRARTSTRWGRSSTRSETLDSERHVNRTKTQCTRRVQQATETTEIRGVPITCILSYCARTLSSSQGTAEDYEMSAPVLYLDAFVSHAWSAPRYKKFLVLAMYYNYVQALAFGTICAVAMRLLGQAGFLPANKILNALLLSDVAFITILLFGHDIAGRFLWPVYMVFLDKVCVHQTDPVLKRKAILGLAGFIRRSKSLLILYCDKYLSRLWTVYELASFLLLQPEAKIEVLPLDLTMMMAASAAMAIANQICCAISLGHCTLLHQPLMAHGVGMACVAFYFLAAVILAIVFSLWARKMQRLLEQLESFDIHAAECSCEEDRPVVLRNVEAFVKTIGAVAPESSRADALAAFNRVVRSTVLSKTKASLGPVGVRYWVSLMVGLQFAYFDSAALATDRLLSQRSWPLDVSLYVCLFLARGPLLVAVAALVARAAVHLRGIAACAAMAANVIVIQLAAHAMDGSLFTLHHLAAKGTPHMDIAFSLLSSVLCLATFLVYCPPRGNEKGLPHESQSEGLPAAGNACA